MLNSYPPTRLKKGNKMKKEKSEALKMRRAILQELDNIAFISRLSWRLNDLKRVYDINSNDCEELLSYFQDIRNIRRNILEESYNLDPSYASIEKARKEEQDEE